jgi:hypothetical protein
MRHWTDDPGLRAQHIAEHEAQKILIETNSDTAAAAEFQSVLQETLKEIQDPVIVTDDKQ